MKALLVANDFLEAPLRAAPDEGVDRRRTSGFRRRKEQADE